jgi:hypothetical protein
MEKFKERFMDSMGFLSSRTGQNFIDVTWKIFLRKEIQ